MHVVVEPEFDPTKDVLEALDISLTLSGKIPDEVLLVYFVNIGVSITINDPVTVVLS